MREPQFVNTDDIRTLFSCAMSRMYRQEVPQYGALVQMMADVNDRTLTSNAQLANQLNESGESDRLDVECHGAIRLGTARELATMRRLFAPCTVESGDRTAVGPATRRYGARRRCFVGNWAAARTFDLNRQGA